MLNIRGFAALSQSTIIEPYQFTRRDPREDDVVIDILYCGVCHSDIHQARNEWGKSHYPLVPGHEIIGKVTQIGNQVKKVNVGDIVGVGCMVDSCRHCSPCEQGLEQYCEQGFVGTYNSVDKQDHLPTYGGYSETIVVTEKFVLTLPEKLDIKSAAPLLCAGITTYSPIRYWQIGKGHKVAVVGLGGLGHMALKLAKAMGAEITLFTRTANKEQEAKRLGADHVILSTDATQMNAALNQFDFIIDTVPHQHDLNPYIETLTFDGVYILVGLLEPIEPALKSAGIVRKRRIITGSLIGGIAETQEMLAFCAEHNITCDVEIINIQDINQAYERMLKSDVKYRFVIDMASLKNTK